MGRLGEKKCTSRPTLLSIAVDLKAWPEHIVSNQESRHLRLYFCCCEFIYTFLVFQWVNTFRTSAPNWTQRNNLILERLIWIWVINHLLITRLEQVAFLFPLGRHGRYLWTRNPENDLKLRTKKKNTKHFRESLSANNTLGSKFTSNSQSWSENGLLMVSHKILPNLSFHFSGTCTSFPSDNRRTDPTRKQRKLRRTGINVNNILFICRSHQQRRNLYAWIRYKIHRCSHAVWSGIQWKCESHLGFAAIFSRILFLQGKKSKNE